VQAALASVGMDKVFTSLAVSVDGFITGRDPGPGHGLGDGGILLHQVPVLLGDGRRFFQELSAHIGLSLVEAVPAPGVTHLRYRIEK
jgi:hypothetical protein